MPPAGPPPLRKHLPAHLLRSYLPTRVTTCYAHAFLYYLSRTAVTWPHAHTAHRTLPRVLRRLQLTPYRGACNSNCGLALPLYALTGHRISRTGCGMNTP